MAFTLSQPLLCRPINCNGALCRRRFDVAQPLRNSGMKSRSTTVIMSNGQPTNGPSVENVIIVGSGPAGYTAAIYAGRANLRPLLLEGIATGAPGGQLMTTEDVENFPGFPNGVTGPQLMAQMREQAVRWGTRLVEDDAVVVDLDTQPFVVQTGDSGELRSHSVIIATGASARRLHVPGEETLWGRGISACAICDGAVPMFSEAPLAVVGGGDSACEEAVYLCKYASHVHLLVRGGNLRASGTLADRVLRHPGVTVHFHTSVVRAIGTPGPALDGGSPLTGLRVRRTNKGEEETMDVRGLFYAIGHTPNTRFLRGNSRIRFDDHGYLITRDGGPKTGQDGVFAAGDVADPIWRQAVTAAGSGCMAALAAERYLAHNGLTIEYHQDDTSIVSAGAANGNGESVEERAANERGPDDASNYNLEDTWHKGQYALRKLYHESKRPLIVKYVSPTCGPCRQLKPMLDAVVRTFEGKVHYVEIDITKDSEIAEAAGVTGSPTVQIFHEKSLIKELRGVKMKSEYRRIVESILAEAVVR